MSTADHTFAPTKLSFSFFACGKVADHTLSPPFTLPPRYAEPPSGQHRGLPTSKPQRNAVAATALLQLHLNTVDRLGRERTVLGKQAQTAIALLTSSNTSSVLRHACCWLSLISPDRAPCFAQPAPRQRRFSTTLK